MLGQTTRFSLKGILDISKHKLTSICQLNTTEEEIEQEEVIEEQESVTKDKYPKPISVLETPDEVAKFMEFSSKPVEALQTGDQPIVLIHPVEEHRFYLVGLRSGYVLKITTDPKILALQTEENSEEIAKIEKLVITHWLDLVTMFPKKLRFDQKTDQPPKENSNLTSILFLRTHSINRKLTVLIGCADGSLRSYPAESGLPGLPKFYNTFESDSQDENIKGEDDNGIPQYSLLETENMKDKLNNAIIWNGNVDYVLTHSSD
ncbi:hypothetical protein HK098_001645, partial [Nowakowskiella sp. JEL0407]